MTPPKTASSQVESFLAQRPERNPPDSESENLGRNPLRTLREERQFSQRDLAQKMGISRAHLQRLESKRPRKFSFGEILRMAEAFSVRIEELLFRFDDGTGTEVKRTSLMSPSFVMNYQDGIRLSSFFDRGTVYFAGILQLPAQKTLPKTQTPRATDLFIYVLEGELLLTLPSRECVLKKGETVHLGKRPLYELYNPNQFKETQLLVMAFPSFASAL